MLELLDVDSTKPPDQPEGAMGAGSFEASIVRFSDNGIVSLREYKRTEAPFEWEPPPEAS